jgi:putative endonuclease
MNKPSKVQIGKNGEEQTTQWLISNGYTILERNYRAGRSEIDIIAMLENTMVFIEVKKRKNAYFGYPEDFVSDAQIERIHAAAEAYMIEKMWQGKVRFDIIALVRNELTHLPDAF